MIISGNVTNDGTNGTYTSDTAISAGEQYSALLFVVPRTSSGTAKVAVPSNLTRQLRIYTYKDGLLTYRRYANNYTLSYSYSDCDFLILSAFASVKAVTKFTITDN